MFNLGKLERVNLREVWQREAGDFTPWLASEENLAELSDVIGLELELESTEKNVGPFRADILCKDTISENWVLIENQLEQTNHTHLGQLLTYATGLDAVTIVWIAERFRDEHRAALDWLNESTNQDINFFGIEVELWRIDESRNAPKFNIVSKPNNWTKTIKAIRQNTENILTPTKELQLDYWDSFNNYLEQEGSFIRSRKARAQHYAYFAIGRSDFRLCTAVNTQKNDISVILELTSIHAKNHYRQLNNQRHAIEAEIGTDLDWREKPNDKFSDIGIYKRNTNPRDTDDWQNQHAWLKHYLEAFHHTFFQRIKTLTA